MDGTRSARWRTADWLPDRWYVAIGANPIITFGFTLAALLVVTVLLARAAPSAQVESTTGG